MFPKSTQYCVKHIYTGNVNDDGPNIFFGQENNKQMVGFKNDEDPLLCAGDN